MALTNELYGGLHSLFILLLPQTTLHDEMQSGYSESDCLFGIYVMTSVFTTTHLFNASFLLWFEKV